MKAVQGENMQINISTGITIAFLALTTAVGVSGEPSTNDSLPIILENGVAKVTIEPSGMARITDFKLISKPLMTIMPLRGGSREEIPGTGVTSNPSSTYGTVDAVWSNGLDTFSKSRYQSQVVVGKDGGRSVRVSADSGEWGIERVMTLRTGSSALDVEVKLVNKGASKQRKSYWFQSFLRLADTLNSMAGDDSELLIVPVRSHPANTQLQDRAMPNVCGEDRLFLRNPETRENFIFAPAAPWIASIDRTNKLVFGLAADPEAFPGDMFFLSWCGIPSEVYSMEAIFQSRELAPGDSLSSKFRLMTLNGLDDVHFLCMDYAFELVNPPKQTLSSDGYISLKMSVLSPFRGSSVKFELILTDAKGQVSKALVELDGLEPDKPKLKDLTIPLASLSPGKVTMSLKHADGRTWKMPGLDINLK